MLRKNKKILTFLLILTLAGSIVSGCNKKKEEAGTSGNIPEQQTLYPLKTDITLRIWSTYAPSTNTPEETPMWKEIIEKTGVKLEFNAAGSTSNENFNVMLASGDLPDLIERDWYSYPGGPEKAINDGFIIRLNDTIDKYSPNLKSYLKANPEVDKSVKTDSGAYYVYPFLRGDKVCQVYQGPMVRKDWLDDLGLNLPVTIDDWFKMLKEFRDKKDAAAPLSYMTWQVGSGARFVGAYGITQGLYVENGKIKYGELDPNFKTFLATFKTWYSEGLIDKNIATVDGTKLAQGIYSNQTGASVSNAGGSMGVWNNELAKLNPNAKMVPTTYPVLKAGDTPKFGQYDQVYTTFGCWAITSMCKNIEIAARFLDYGYSKEGSMIYNFGVEGTSYTMVNGYPKYTDLIVKNPEGRSMGEMLGSYVRANNSGPFIQDKRYVEQFLARPEQQDALKLWTKTEIEKHMIPRITLTTEESEEVVKINADLNKYRDDMFWKFVMGAESLDNYDKYVEQLRKLGADRIVQLHQQALDRFNKR